MKTYLVTFPIAGHLSFEVEAESEEQAKDMAYELEAEKGELEYEILEKFNSGNVCHCPSPWETDVYLIDDNEEP
jgi:hypothetical protein